MSQPCTNGYQHISAGSNCKTTATAQNKKPSCKKKKTMKSLPIIELSLQQEIHLVDSTSFELLGPSASFEELSSSYSSSQDSLVLNEDSNNILQVPMAAVELVDQSLDTNDYSVPWAAPAPVEQRKRAALLSATIVRNSPQEKLGLGLAMTSRGTLIISSIRPGGLLSVSPFKVGDRLISINNVSCEHMRKSEAAQFLRNVTGTLTVVVQNDSGDSQLVESMIWKPQPDSKTGLAVVSNGYTRARVSNIRPNGLFERSLLSRKDLILSVNNIPCHFLDSKEVADIVTRAKDYVTVVAERLYENAVVVAMEQ